MKKYIARPPGTKDRPPSDNRPLPTFSGLLDHEGNELHRPTRPMGFRVGEGE